MSTMHRPSPVAPHLEHRHELRGDAALVLGAREAEAVGLAVQHAGQLPQGGLRAERDYSRLIKNK